MNIVNKLTLRQLMLNKKRTIVTIIGTIISAAMITAVATLGLSFMDIVRRQTIADGGEWHVIYKDVNKSQYDAINADKETKLTLISRESGYAPLESGENLNKPYLYIMEYNTAAFENFPVKLTQGRLPERPDEIVISEAVYQNAKVNYKIGDKLTLDIGQRFSEEESEEPMVLDQTYSLQRDGDEIKEYLTSELTKTYTIVGMIERPTWEYTWSPGYTALSYIDENTVTAKETFHTSVVVKHINNKLFAYAGQLAEKNGIESFGYNNELLRYYGVIKDDSLRSMLFTLSGIIMVIIVVGSVSLIYNAFAISVSERSRYLGMLSSVGATKRQKRNSVFFEGAVIGAISIPIGIVAGYVGLGITYLFINPMFKQSLGSTEGFQLKVYPSSVLVAVLISAVTIFISTYIPARRASNVSAIDAIRQSMDVKIKGRQVKTSKITRKVFGIEAELGLKNLKRYRGRYKATVFSLIISMMLFLVVSAFTDNIRRSMGLTLDGINFDIQASVDNTLDEERDAMIQEMLSLEDITENTRVDVLDVKTLLKETNVADHVKSMGEDYLENGKYPYYITLNVLDDAALERYTKEAGVDYKSIANSDQPTAIVIDYLKYKDQQQDKFIETKSVKVKPGERFDLSFSDPETGNDITLNSVEVAALTDVYPMGIVSMGRVPSFHIIMSQDSFQKIIAGNEDMIAETMNTKVYFKSDNPLRLQENLEELQNKYGVSRLDIYNVYQFRQNEEQMVLLMSVFTYAFIILITAICVANIINTISTSISLRKREFAMLKSVGMTPKGFNKMLNYESIFYGLKSVLYGIPISIGVMYLMHQTLYTTFEFPFTLPVDSMIFVIVAIFTIVGVAMLYSSNKVKKENIIDALKQEIV
ncbi:MAG: cell division protein FtsX [Herbinix sp.]|jgi:putative ABC transport system permease protein|nr:cell division protein FtsX [Herbinix sp.]